MRFGRIPKREKQRLLDEMQSYMNSLNESGAMDEMEVSPAADGLCSPEVQAAGGPGSVPQSYCATLISADEKPLKMAAGGVGALSFQDNALHPAAQAQHSAPGEQANLPSGYHIPAGCPVAPTKAENHASADNAKYSFSSSPARCPFSGSLSSQSYQASQTSHPRQDCQSQSPCPWKLNGGAKVLVRFYYYCYYYHNHYYCCYFKVAQSLLNYTEEVSVHKK